MGCPPDPIEVSMWRSRERANEQIEKEKTCLQKFRHLNAILAPVINACGEIPLIKTLWERYNRLIVAAEVTDAPPSEDTSQPDGDVRFAYANEEYAVQNAKAAETKLCALRDFLVNIWEAEEVKTRFKELQGTVEKEIAAHAVHREEDRQTWLAWLNDKKEGNEWLINDAKEEKRKTLYTERLRKIMAEIERVTALTPHQILMDCTLFGRNSTDFDPFGT